MQNMALINVFCTDITLTQKMKKYFKSTTPLLRVKFYTDTFKNYQYWIKEKQIYILWPNNFTPNHQPTKHAHSHQMTSIRMFIPTCS